jgi:SAM-dependent methyltransferase
MTYQSFDPGSGSSDSHGKLAALLLPDLTGKTVLDLGCNQGFFCFAAVERGASFVTGIDRNPAHIAAATDRALLLNVTDRVQFLNMSWDESLAQTFDVVFLFSALHYAQDQPAFLSKIATLLNPGGLFVLEAGITDTDEAWTSVKRGRDPDPAKGRVQYPNKVQMLAMLRRDFAPRLIGPSVMQKGDPVPRFVLHCRKIMQIVICIAGRAEIGKSTLARFVASKGLPIVSLDGFYIDLVTADLPISTLAREIYKPRQLGQTYKALVSGGHSHEFAAALASAIQERFEAERVVAIEGTLFAHHPFLEAFQDECRKRAIVVWVANRVV